MRTTPGPDSAGEPWQSAMVVTRPDGDVLGPPVAPPLLPASKFNRGRPSSAVLDRLAGLATFVTVVGVVAFVFAQLQPGLIFLPTMDVGGDTAAHIVAVFYFIHHLLPQLKLSGWDPQWFDGFPLYTFYFPLPAVLVAFFSLFAPYAVAFKMVTALGSVTLPLAAYAFGRLVALKRPLPALLAVATVPYLFNNAYSIDGGNVLSTMAGEFSFSLSVSFAVLFLGVFIRAIRTGRLRWLAAVLFVCTVTSHLVPAIFAAGAAVVFFLLHPDPTERPTTWPDDAPGAIPLLRFLAHRGALWSFKAYRRPARVLLGVGVAGGLTSAFWLVPFYAFGVHDSLTSSMNYGRVPGTLWANILPHNEELAVLLLAALGLVVGLRRHDRVVAAFGTISLLAAALFQFAPSGLVYNGRWLPFWYLGTAFLAAFGTRDLLHGLALLVRLAFVVASSTAVRGEALDPAVAASLAAERAAGASALERYEAIVVPVTTGGAVVVLFAAWLGVLPFFNLAQRNFANNWTNFNYAGYQRKPGWPEFQRVVAMLDRVGATNGCGRLDYEYSKNVSNWFGSTLVPMSFPLWTNGCIDSAEGVYFESSTTTYFHFLDQAELAMDASNPVGGLPYQNLSVVDGVRHLQLEGVKYFLANSPTVEAQAAKDPSLVELASTPASVDAIDVSGSGTATPIPGGYHWIVYEIKNSPLVAPLRYQPVVEPDIFKQFLQSTAVTWYQNEQYWAVPIARGGPTSWRRVPTGNLVAPAQAVPVIPTVVSHITSTDSSVSFDVTRLGSPVVVKEPYFPNWQASGAQGPWELTPNLMVVVPTSHHVVVSYGSSGVDWIAKGASLGGLAVLGFLALSPPVPPAPDPEPPYPAGAFEPDVTRRDGHLGSESPPSDDDLDSRDAPASFSWRGEPDPLQRPDNDRPERSGPEPLEGEDL